MTRDDRDVERAETAALLGDDGDATVDSSHPTDLGFMRHADVFEPVLRSALSASVSKESGQ